MRNDNKNYEENYKAISELCKDDKIILPMKKNITFWDVRKDKIKDS